MAANNHDDTAELAAWLETQGREPDDSYGDVIVPIVRHRTNGHKPEGEERPRRLPDSFWQARSLLEHIRTAARSRMVAPDALLASVLARACVATDRTIVLPPIVGPIASLNLTIAVVGPSGGGKGAAVGVSSEIVTADDQGDEYRVGEAPAGSGEGMVHAFYEMVPDPDDKRRKVPRRRYEGLLIRCDEGQVLTALAQRSGQTTMETLRSAFSGERLGGAYASSDKRLSLTAHDYRLVVLLGVQPEHARAILDDDAGGTPQRFLWFDALDPEAPHPDQLPEWPGPLDWKPPRWWDGITPLIGQDRRRELDVHPDVVREIRWHRHQINTGAVTPGRYDGHRNLVKLKAAAVLGLLDDRLTVTPDDWALAGQIVDASDAMRDSMWTSIHDAQTRKDTAWNQRHAARAAAEEGARIGVTTNVLRISRGIGRRIAKLDPGDTLTRSELRKSLASADRSWFEEAVAHAEAQGWLTTHDDGRHGHGDSIPA